MLTLLPVSRGCLEEAGCKSSVHSCSLCVFLLHSAYLHVLGYKHNLIVKRLNFDLCTGCVVGFISAPQARLGLRRICLSAAALGIRSSWPHCGVHSSVMLAATQSCTIFLLTCGLFPMWCSGEISYSVTLGLVLLN